MKNLLQIPLILIRHLKLLTTHPYTIRDARIIKWTWACAALFAAVSLGLDIIHGADWWWYPVHAAVLLMDVTMLRWAIRGYYYRRAADAEEARVRAELAEFNQIISQL